MYNFKKLYSWPIFGHEEASILYSWVFQQVLKHKGGFLRINNSTFHPQSVRDYPYPFLRYICACGKSSHVAYRLFDQMPPERCPEGKRLLRDSKYVDPNRVREAA